MPSSLAGEAQAALCSLCGLTVKLDPGIAMTSHECVKQNPILPRRRLRGPPPYPYGDTKSAGRKRQRIIDEKRKKADPEREIWLEREVLNRHYDPAETWCRYCGAFQTSGWARGPWYV